MQTIDWHSLFQPPSKQQWLDKIIADSKGALSEKELIRDVGDGITIHAVQTRHDLNALEHLSPNSPFRQLKWRTNSDWGAGYPLSIDNKDAAFKEEARRAFDLGASSLFMTSTELDSFSFSAHHTGLKELLHANDQPFIVFPQLPSDLPPKKHKSLLTALSFPKDSTLHKTVDIGWLPGIEIDTTNTLGQFLINWDSRLAKTNSIDEFDEFISHFQIAVSIGLSFYPEIARLRALRFLISRLTLEHYPKYNKELRIPIISLVSSMASGLDRLPEFLLHSTTASISAVIGGCNTLVILPPSSFSDDQRYEALRLATNLQLMLKHESHLHKVQDPAQGSYYIEVLTDQFIKTSWAYYEKNR